MCDHTNSITDNREFSQKVQRYVGAKFADKIITLTQEDCRNYIKKYGISEEKIDYIYNWKDDGISNVAYNDESAKIVTVGRFDYQKDMIILSSRRKSDSRKRSDWIWGNLRFPAIK